jgi:very-short-patch-repair endonuclease
VVLPGVYGAHGQLLTAPQRENAAVLYAGSGCVITGFAALRRHGLRVPMLESVDVLIPANTRRLSVGSVQIHRTIRMPERPWELDGINWAPPARALADAVRAQMEFRDARALVADAVQHGRCTVKQLALELAAGPRQGSGALRAALEEVADGVKSVAEGDLRKLINNGRLPVPLYNPRLFVGDAFLAMPDAWWAEAGVAVEVDSREWHLSPADWERTQARHAAMSAHGILVLHYAPRRIRTDGAAVLAEIRAAIEAGRRRPPLAIRAVPST